MPREISLVVGEEPRRSDEYPYSFLVGYTSNGWKVSRIECIDGWYKIFDEKNVLRVKMNERYVSYVEYSQS